MARAPASRAGLVVITTGREDSTSAAVARRLGMLRLRGGARENGGRPHGPIPPPASHSGRPIDRMWTAQTVAPSRVRRNLVAGQFTTQKNGKALRGERWGQLRGPP